MERKVVRTAQAPAAVGPYSQGIVAGGFVFTAGQIPLDPGTMKLVQGDFKHQVHQVLHNLNAVLSNAGTDLGRVVKCTVFLTDLKQFPLVNEVFQECFNKDDPPARSVVQVSALPLDAVIEIECVAAL